LSGLRPQPRGFLMPSGPLRSTPSIVALVRRFAIAGVSCALSLVSIASQARAATNASTDSLAAEPTSERSHASPPAASSPPAGVQLNAPSINTASPDLVDQAEFPATAGVAWDERLEPGPNDRALTLNVTPLAIARAVGRGDCVGPAGRPLDWMSRVAARVTIGGPLQKVERRNARRAWRPTNHVTSELKM